MLNMKIRLRICVLGIVFLSGIWASEATLLTADHEGKETFTGTIVGIGGELGGVTRPFTLTIKGQTSDEEAAHFIDVLKSGGQEALLRAIHKEDLGQFAVEGNVGRKINAVREHRTEHGRKITLVFERWLRMFELRYGTRSEDYPFSYVELYIDDDGKGEGSIIPAAKIYFDNKERNTVAIENFGIYPARLANVRLATR
jgi:hypothetical protein